MESEDDYITDERILEIVEDARNEIKYVNIVTVSKEVEDE